MKTKNQESIIVLGAGLLVEPMLRKVKALGFNLIVFEWNMDLPGLKLADVVVRANLKDTKDTVEKAKMIADQYRIRGVNTCGADIEVAVAAIAETLGLPGIPVEVARDCNDKIRMRRRLGNQGINDVRWAEVENASEALASAKELDYPCVIKPADNCGSRGVKKVSGPDELLAWFEVAQKWSINKKVFLEEYLSGPKQTVEMIVYGGKIHLISIIDTHYIYEEPERYPWGDFPVETGLHVTELSEDVQQELFRYAKRIVRAMGVDFGPVKVDTTITPYGIRVIELTARLSGGFHCQYATPLALGTDEIGAVIRTSAGLPLDIKDISPQWSRGSCVWTKLPAPGRIISISGVEQAKSMPGIDQVFLLKDIGDEVGPYQNSTDRFCFVIGHGENTAEAKQNVFRSLEAMTIKTEPC